MNLQIALVYPWFDALPVLGEYESDGGWYGSRREAEDAAAIAFSKLPPEVAERILASVNNDSPAESAK